jgi:hypothetical protein
VSDRPPSTPFIGWALPRSLDPERLVAEIGLLIEYISGRGRSTPPGGPAPPGLASIFAVPPGSEMLKRFLRVCNAGLSRMPREKQSTQTLSDAQVSACETLVETRDWLNGLAAPVTGDTIAFSILVGRFRGGHPNHSDDAEAAFPSYVPEARRMRRYYVITRAVTLGLILLVFSISAWSIFGTMALGSLSNLRTRTELVEHDKANKEAVINGMQAPANRNAAAVRDDRPQAGAYAYLRYCDASEFVEYLAGRNPHYAVIDADQIGFCNHRADLTNRRDDAYQTLNFWFLGGLPRLGWLAEDVPAGPARAVAAAAGRAGPKQHGTVREASINITDEAARIWLAVVVGSILPLFMAMLGSNVAVLRDYFQKIRDRMLAPKDLRLFQVRTTLGVVAGVAVGFFLAPVSPALPVSAVAGSATSGALASAASLASTASLSAPALGFVAGFAVDLFFQFLESAAGVLFQRRP